MMAPSWGPGFGVATSGQGLRTSVLTMGDYIYVKFLLNSDTMTSSTPATIDFTAPTNYRVLRNILTSKHPFLQNEVAKEAAAHPPQVSTVVRWLQAHQHVIRRKTDGRYEVAQPASLVIAVFPYQRVMDRTLVGTVKVRSTPEDVCQLLTREGATLCLESALSVHSEFFRPDRVAVYHSKPKKLLKQIAPNEGGLLPVSVYEPDIPLEGDVEEPDSDSPFRRTARFRTLVDLVCDNRAYAAKDLFWTLWGVRFG